MNITLSETNLKTAQNNSPFVWVTSAIKYLGIWLTPRLSSIFDRNFPPLFKTIEKDLQDWHPKHFSWFGRAAICKMTVLPKILYLLRTLPIKIPQSFFKALHSMQMKFIWAYKPPCIKSILLTRPKEMGGMGIPDFKAYYYASHITRIIDWHCHSNLKDWVLIENDMSTVPLQFSPWVPKTRYPFHEITSCDRYYTRHIPPSYQTFQIFHTPKSSHLITEQPRLPTRNREPLNETSRHNVAPSCNTLLWQQDNKISQPI